MIQLWADGGGGHEGQVCVVPCPKHTERERESLTASTLISIKSIKSVFNLALCIVYI
jgi:hypothetical protein